MASTLERIADLEYSLSALAKRQEETERRLARAAEWFLHAVCGDSDDPPDPGTCPRCGDLHKCEQVESANFETSRIPVSGVCPECKQSHWYGTPCPQSQPERAEPIVRWVVVYADGSIGQSALASPQPPMRGSARYVKLIEAGPLAGRLREIEADTEDGRCNSSLLALARELETDHG